MKKPPISIKGYKKDSPDRHNPMNIIPSDRITMKGVNHPVLMIPMREDGMGNPVMGVPGEEYYFPGSHAVMEFPMPKGSHMSYMRFQKGGTNPPDLAAMSHYLNQKYKNLNWVERGLYPELYPNIVEQDRDGRNFAPETHRLGYAGNALTGYRVFPDIIQNEFGALKRLGDAAPEYAKRTNTYIPIPNQRLADYYSRNGLIKHYQKGGSPWGGYFPEMAAYAQAEEESIPEVSLPGVQINAEAPWFAKRRDAYYQKYPKEWYFKNKLPKQSRAFGLDPTGKNWHPNTTAEYNQFIMDKVAKDLLDRNPNFNKEYRKDRVKALSQFTPKELEVIQQSSWGPNISPSGFDKFDQAMQKYSPIRWQPGTEEAKLVENRYLTPEEKAATTPLDLLSVFDALPKVTQKLVGYRPPYQHGDRTWGESFWGRPTAAPAGADILLDASNLIGLGAMKKIPALAGPFSKIGSATAKVWDGTQAAKNVFRNVKKNYALEALKTPGLESPPLQSLALKKSAQSKPGLLETLGEKAGNLEILHEPIHWWQKRMFDKKKQEVLNRMSTPQGKKVWEERVRYEAPDDNPMTYDEMLDYVKSIEYEKFRTKSPNAYATHYELNPEIEKYKTGEVDEKGQAFYLKPENIPWYVSRTPAIGFSGHYALNPKRFSSTFEHELQHLFQNPKLYDKGARDAYASMSQLDNAGRNLEIDPRVTEEAMYMEASPEALQRRKDLKYLLHAENRPLSEVTPFVAEMRDKIVNKGFAKNYYDISPQDIQKYHLSNLKSGKLLFPDDRLSHLITPSPSNYDLLSNVMKRMLTVPPAAFLGNKLYENSTTKTENEDLYSQGGTMKKLQRGGRPDSSDLYRKLNRFPKAIGDAIYLDPETGKRWDLDLARREDSDTKSFWKELSDFYLHEGVSPEEAEKMEQEDWDLRWLQENTYNRPSPAMYHPDFYALGGDTQKTQKVVKQPIPKLVPSDELLNPDDGRTPPKVSPIVQMPEVAEAPFYSEGFMKGTRSMNLPDIENPYIQMQGYAGDNDRYMWRTKVNPSLMKQSDQYKELLKFYPAEGSGYAAPDFSTAYPKMASLFDDSGFSKQAVDNFEIFDTESMDDYSHNLDLARQLGMIKRFGGSPTEKQFFSYGYVPTGPYGFYAYGGALPGGANEMPCFECGGNTMAEGGWIQKATESIERRGTEGVCTGSNFGGPGCPPGSKRYNLAKTFRAMAKKKDGGKTVVDPNEDDFLPKYSAVFQNKLKENTMRNIADEAASAFENQYFAQYGTQVSPYNDYLRNMYAQQIGAMDAQREQAGSNMYGATFDLFQNQSPYLKSLQIKNGDQLRHFGPGGPNSKMDAYELPESEKRRIAAEQAGQNIAALNASQNSMSSGATSTTPVTTTTQGKQTSPGTGATGVKANSSQTSGAPATGTFEQWLAYQQWLASQGQQPGQQQTGYNNMANLFPMNVNWRTRGDNFIPMVAYNPANTYLQKYDYRGRLFGRGPRRLTMDFRTYFNPATGKTEEVPVEQTVPQMGKSATPGIGGKSGSAIGSMAGSSKSVSPKQEATANSQPAVTQTPSSETTSKNQTVFAAPVPVTTPTPVSKPSQEKQKPVPDNRPWLNFTQPDNYVQQNPGNQYRFSKPAPTDATPLYRFSPGQLYGYYQESPSPAFPTISREAQVEEINRQRVLEGKPAFTETEKKALLQGATPLGTLPLSPAQIRAQEAYKKQKELEARNKGFNYDYRNTVPKEAVYFDGPGHLNISPNVLPEITGPFPASQIPRQGSIMDFMNGGYLPKAQDGMSGMLGRQNAKNMMNPMLFEEDLQQQQMRNPAPGTSGFNKDGFMINKDGTRTEGAPMYEDWQAIAKYARGYQNEDLANWLMAGADTLTSFANADEYNKLKSDYQRLTLADNVMTGMPANRIDSRGRYVQTGMPTGMMDMQNMVPIQQPGQNYNFENPYMEYGGGYEEGGEYELSPEEIEYIMANGGSVTYID